jgi:hypothetical protein
MRICKSKLGQVATQAGVVVVLIAVLMVLYILFLSPQDRAELLGEDSGSGSGGSGSGGSGRVRQLLFSATPGRIYLAGADSVEHTMPSLTVFTVTNANELKRVQSLYVKSSVFSSTIKEVVFFYDKQTTTDLKLSFNVKKHDGRLIIKLNGYELFDGELAEGSPTPITLPADYLQEKNTLVFSVSDMTGIAFWKVNEYELENVLISGRVTDYSGAFSERHFSLSATEYENFDKALFEFIPDCPPREAGLVQILINNRVIYTGYPDCGVKSRVEVSQEFLKPGDNALVATTNSGSFLLDMPKLVIMPKKGTQPIFYVNVPVQLYNEMYYGQRLLILTLRFADSTTLKQGNVEINGFKNYFETQDIIYQTEIDPEFIIAGQNPIKISPHSDPIDVAELRVDVI